MLSVSVKFHVIEDHDIHVIRLQVKESPHLCDKIVLYAFYSPLVDVQANAGYNFDK